MARRVRADPAACRAYWEALCLRLTGDLQVATLARALRAVVHRHEALRARLAPDGLQVILPAVEVDLSLSAPPDGDVAEWWRATVEAPADLERGPLFRFALARTGPREHLLAFSVHHLVSDGWSIDVLLRELGAVYGALREARAPVLAEPMQFGDWAARAARLHVASAETHLAYWGEVARGLGDVAVPRRAEGAGYHGARRTVEIDGALVRRLRAASARAGRTPFMTLFGAFTHLLHEVYEREVVVAGVSSACRGVPGCEGTVGELAQVLPVVSLRAASLEQGVAGASRSLLELYAHQEYPFALAAAHLARLGLPVPEPVATFNLDPIAASSPFPGLAMEIVPQPVFCVRRELSINLLPATGDALLLDCDHRTDAFAADEIAAILARFATLLEELAVS